MRIPRQRYAEGFQASSLGPLSARLGKGAAPRVRFGFWQFGNLGWLGLAWLGLAWLVLGWVGLACYLPLLDPRRERTPTDQTPRRTALHKGGEQDSPKLRHYDEEGEGLVAFGPSLRGGLPGGLVLLRLGRCVLTLSRHIHCG